MLVTTKLRLNSFLYHNETIVIWKAAITYAAHDLVPKCQCAECMLVTTKLRLNSFLYHNETVVIWEAAITFAAHDLLHECLGIDPW